MPISFLIRFPPRRSLKYLVCRLDKRADRRFAIRDGAIFRFLLKCVVHIGHYPMLLSRTKACPVGIDISFLHKPFIQLLAVVDSALAARLFLLLGRLSLLPDSL